MRVERMSAVAPEPGYLANGKPMRGVAARSGAMAVPTTAA